jgi:hypothetical protein
MKILTLPSILEYYAQTKKYYLVLNRQNQIFAHSGLLLAKSAHLNYLLEYFSNVHY